MISARSRMLLVVGIGIGSLGLAAPAQAAGFFDELARAVFGQPAMRLDPGSVPLDVTVRPTRRQQPRKAVASKPSPPAVKLDPAADPHWYLSDPTLRRGDIVVTASDVLVFEGRGGESHASSDFAALDKSRLASKATRRLVSAAARQGRLDADMLVQKAATQQEAKY